VIRGKNIGTDGATTVSILLGPLYIAAMSSKQDRFVKCIGQKTKRKWASAGNVNSSLFACKNAYCARHFMHKVSFLHPKSKHLYPVVCLRGGERRTCLETPLEVFRV